MASVDEITKAIGAHGMWKTRLKMAIATGKVDVPVETIGRDDQCAFGQWLHGGSLAPADKTSNHYTKVKSLHAEFHKTAARVAQLALGGKKSEAEAMMTMTGGYAVVSGQLTDAMMEWKKLAK